MSASEFIPKKLSLCIFEGEKKSIISFNKVEFLYFHKGTRNSNQLHQSNDGSASGEDR